MLVTAKEAYHKSAIYEKNKESLTMVQDLIQGGIENGLFEIEISREKIYDANYVKSELRKLGYVTGDVVFKPGMMFISWLKPKITDEE